MWRVRLLYRRRFRMTLGRWLVRHQREVVFEKCQWMGVPALKNPLDAWIYQEIIHEVRPDVVVEIGSGSGGSTLYFAHLLEILGNGVVVSVDISRDTFVAAHDRIVVVTGHSSSAETVERVRELCEGKRVFVIHDGDHKRAQVLEDLAAYSPLVSVGSYFVVEDGIVDLFSLSGMGAWYDGPLVATEEFLAANPEFEADEERERYLVTYNPKGFLRRLR